MQVDNVQDNVQGFEGPGGGGGGGATKMNPKTTIGLGAPHCSLSMGPQGIAMPVRILLRFWFDTCWQIWYDFVFQVIFHQELILYGHMHGVDKLMQALFWLVKRKPNLYIYFYMG